jgi:serine/threonine protein kinase
MPSEVKLLLKFSLIISHYLTAHESLCHQGILHRDISAGNVMLTEAQNTELRGFITDLEFARFEKSTVETKERTVERPVIPQKKYADRGESYTTTDSAISKHTTFQSVVTIKRGAGITVCDLLRRNFPLWVEIVIFFHREQLNS